MLTSVHDAWLQAMVYLIARYLTINMYHFVPASATDGAVRFFPFLVYLNVAIFAIE